MTATAREVDNFRPESRRDTVSDGTAAKLHSDAYSIERASPQVVAARGHLERLAKTNLDADSFSNLQIQMKEFEKRAREQKLSDKEVAQTYGYVGRLLESNASVPTTKVLRGILAEQIIQLAADPRLISQGNHETCNVTTVESVTYTRCPSRAARMVSDLALAGKFEYKDVDGRHHILKIDQLRPTDEARDVPVEDGKRCYASQIFQVAAINLAWSRATKCDGVSGRFKYEQVEPTGPKDTGERLWNTAVHPQKQISDTPYLDAGQIIDICNRITGTENCLYLGYNDGRQPAQVIGFASPQELRETLIAAKKLNLLPAIIEVSTDQNPFWSEMKGPKWDAADNTWHVVTIRDFDAVGNRVAIANQWTRADNHFAEKAVNVHDLFLATRKIDYTDPADATKGTIPEIEKEVETRKQRNLRDFVLELELLRMKHAQEIIEDQQFEDEVLSVTRDAHKHWAPLAGDYEKQKYEQFRRELRLVIKNEPLGYRLQIWQELSK